MAQADTAAFRRDHPLKEAYFDRIVERQVNFNRRFAGAIQELDQSCAGSSRQPASLTRRTPMIALRPLA